MNHRNSILLNFMLNHFILNQNTPALVRSVLSSIGRKCGHGLWRKDLTKSNQSPAGQVSNLVALCQVSGAEDGIIWGPMSLGSPTASASLGLVSLWAHCFPIRWTAGCPGTSDILWTHYLRSAQWLVRGSWQGLWLVLCCFISAGYWKAKQTHNPEHAFYRYMLWDYAYEERAGVNGEREATHTPPKCTPPHIHTHTCTHSHVCTYPHTCTHSLAHAHKHMHTHICIPSTCTHTPTYTLPHTHVRILRNPAKVSCSRPTMTVFPDPEPFVGSRVPESALLAVQSWP